MTAGQDGVDSSDDHGFPWEFRVGNELAKQWSLADAAGDPLLGLPRLPERDLPESPFRHLAWFAAEHAEVFFGRGYQIRELYEGITDKSGSPIHLLYGASGVGKSSLLDAGLVPRLIAGGYEVRYCRRDAEAGLLGTLDARCPRKPTVSRWATPGSEEARLGRPVVVLLDQVEEVVHPPEPGPAAGGRRPGRGTRGSVPEPGEAADREARARVPQGVVRRDRPAAVRGKPGPGEALPQAARPQGRRRGGL